MKIPENVIPYTYKESKRVFENKLSVKEAAENIHKNCGVKITSSIDYAYYFRYLMTGNGSCRGLSKFTQEYFLKNILEDYKNDNEQKKKTLLHFKKLIEKFEGEKVGSKKSMRVIYEKYKTLVEE
jgi:hypothetical protein